MSDRIISDYFLERFVLGELPPDETEEVARAAATDPSVRAALDDLRASNREILACYPAADIMAALIGRRNGADLAEVPLGRRRFLSVPAPAWKRWTVFASAGAVLVLAAVLIVPRIRESSRALSLGSTGEQNLVKGEAALDLTKTQLLVYRKANDSVELADEGDEFGAGALLQLAYVSAAECYGMILSIDGRGHVTRHFPADDGGPTALSRNKRIFLPNALELDDAPGFERFFLITSPEPIDVKAVLAEAVELAKDPNLARRSELALPSGLKQTSVLLLKEGGTR